MKKVLFTAILIVWSIAVTGQNGVTKKHPIDLKLEQCLATDSNQTTYGMIMCEQIAVGEWDKELNKYYNLLRSVLKSEEKAKLKTAQIKWIEYRDNELEFSGYFYGNMEGTMWGPVAVHRQAELIKQRALELKDYYETHDSGN